MTYGVLVNGVFEERALISMKAQGFDSPLQGRADTYDHYVMREISKSYGKLPTENRYVLDVGANIGCFTAFAARNATQVISFEPEQNNFKMLKLNCENLQNTVIYSAALTDNLTGEMNLYIAPSGKNPGNSSTTDRRGRTAVPIYGVSVADLKARHPHITAAKIDCEGAEYDIMGPLLEQYPTITALTMEIHISGYGVDKARNLHNMILSRGFKATVEPRFSDKAWNAIATYEATNG